MVVIIKVEFVSDHSLIVRSPASNFSINLLYFNSSIDWLKTPVASNNKRTTTAIIRKVVISLVQLNLPFLPLLFPPTGCPGCDIY